MSSHAAVLAPRSGPIVRVTAGQVGRSVDAALSTRFTPLFLTRLAIFRSEKCHILSLPARSLRAVFCFLPASLPDGGNLPPVRPGSVLKPLISRVLSVVKRVGVLVGFDFFPVFSRMAGKFASTASATIAAPFVRAAGSGASWAASLKRWSRAPDRRQRNCGRRCCRSGDRGQEERQQIPQLCHGCVSLVELIPRCL